ncbi:MAG: hypothetical protein CO158_02830 [Piscirickettsiaceae bacterium CG_4_9_14_3_um_filter_43_564]|nr:HDOD domain-containing protein [Thiomicrospira sp.]PIQ03538.1 MAG: hypothetical protein COW74_07025 [Piscirickettsiaceae bacterium CG18_big_fil_WC_8_21_14_2_50_44_103]PIU38058.1 MAG: hypothetical protein COT01_08440 [Piscirickettsiaceae bacterium CG07_land_8_20_14_0_80_44_28]PIW56630.1 MAG: hypothetical protein COW14_10255 [Piscirickettsiaceae bacterium CG12_big_fil_rev_8_21_14_0_65_44_934]PIW77242.1 MAG: hypothetical protein CO000_07885 [Piscirickettsiaceae bacterium CG_4_8_14_3_um_filter_4
MDLKQQIQLAQSQLAGFEVPPLPAELLKLQAIFQTTEFPELSEVAEIIGQNTVLTGELIRVANQSQFLRKGSDSVQTIKGAIDSLGMTKLKNLVFGLGFKAQIPELAFTELMEHTLDVANVAAALSHWVEGIQADEAYLAGVFHNAGAIIMEMKFGEYRSTFFNTLTNCYSGLSKEIEKYQVSHGVYGLLVAKKWRLDSRYAQVMLMHHQRNLAVIKDDHVRALVAIIQLANVLVSEVSFDSYIGQEVREMSATTREELLIDGDVIDEIRTALLSNSLV